MFGITHFVTLSDAERQDRNKVIFDLWLAGKTEREIAKSAHLSKTEIHKVIGLVTKIKAEKSDQNEKPPIYNVWNYSLILLRRGSLPQIQLQ